VVNAVGRSSGDLEVVGDVVEEDSGDDDGIGGDVVGMSDGREAVAVDHEKRLSSSNNIDCREKHLTS
jgi:hypothetical protein